MKTTHVLEIAVKPMSLISWKLVNLRPYNQDTMIPGDEAVDVVGDE